MKNTVRLSPFQSLKIHSPRTTPDLEAVVSKNFFFNRCLSGQVPPSQMMMAHQSLTWIRNLIDSLEPVASVQCFFVWC